MNYQVITYIVFPLPSIVFYMLYLYFTEHHSFYYMTDIMFH